jgi:polysaccharide biosynthesis/export protein
MATYAGVINIAAALLMSLMGAVPVYASGYLSSHQSLADNNSGSADTPSMASLQHRDPRYRVAPGDVLDLNFQLSPEFNQTLTVAPDGYITLRGIGDLHAAGQSLPELVTSLEAAYSKILHDPVVTVDLKDFQKPYFTVGGQVGHPGKFDLRENTTVTEAVAIAGGFLDSAKHSEVLLFRRMPGGNFLEAKKLDVKKMLKAGNLEEDMYLRPGDMVYVPKNTISKIDRFIPTSGLSLYAPGMP